MAAYVGTKPIGQSSQGWPIWQYRDDAGALRYVVVPPGGAPPFYSDEKGTPIIARVAATNEPQAANFVGAAVGGVVGAFFGPIGAAIGAGLGAWLAGEVTKDNGGRK